MDEFWKSQVIADRYEFVEELGRGGIGTVVLALDKTLDKHVAIKILNANLSSEESIRFQQEGILAGRLNHENIVAVLDFGVTDTNIPYLIMEHLQGFSLASMVTADGALETLFAVRIFQQICRGMRSSHNAGVVHRDLKPTNVFMVQIDDETLFAKIVDFGLARLLDENARLTAPGTAIGSPFYMSPEQGQGLPGDERSDIYSMGCLMYNVLTGHTPFEGDTAMLTIMMHQQAKPDKLSTKTGKTFPSMLEQIVAKCLNKNPDERYQGFNDLLTDLEKLEAEIVRLEREEALESVSRSGLQRALSSVTDFATPLAAASRKKISIPLLIALSVGVAAAFGIYAMMPQLVALFGDSEEELELKEKAKTPEVVEYADNLDTFTKLEVKEKGGLLFCKGYGENSDPDLVQLKNAKHIEELNLSGSSCNGTGLSALHDTTIKELNLDNTPLNDEGMAEVGKVKGLTTLLIKDCDELKASSLAYLAGNKTVKNFSLSESEGLKEDVLKDLLTLPELESVGLDEFHLTKNGISEVLKNPKLHSIMFEECELGSGVLDTLAAHKKPFVRIGFADTKLTPQMVSSLKHVRAKHLTLHDVEMTGAVFAQIFKDPRYAWSEIGVDDKKVPDRG